MSTRAYIAGIFDGEGCVFFRKKGPPLLTISQKERGLLDWIQGQTGVGHVYLCGKYHQYHVGNRQDIQTFIRFIYPYSRVKRAALKKAYHHKYSRI